MIGLVVFVCVCERHQNVRIGEEKDEVEKKIKFSFVVE